MANKDKVQFTFFDYDTNTKKVSYKNAYIGAVSCAVYKNTAIMLVADDCKDTTWDEERCFELSYEILALRKQGNGSSANHAYNFCKKYSGDISKADCTLKIENGMIYCALNGTAVPVEDVIGCSYKDANCWYHKTTKTDVKFIDAPVVLVIMNTFYGLTGYREHISFDDVDFGAGYLKYKLLFETLTDAMQRRNDISFEDAVALCCEHYSQTQPELKALVENVIRICDETFDADDRNAELELLKGAVAEYEKLLEKVSETGNINNFFEGIELLIGVKEIKQYVKERFLEALAVVEDMPDDAYDAPDFNSYLSGIEKFEVYKNI